jgi:hypothetical protein
MIAMMAPFLLQSYTGLAFGSLSVFTNPDDCDTAVFLTVSLKLANSDFRSYMFYFYKSTNCV